MICRRARNAGARIPYLHVLDYNAPGWAEAVVYIRSRKGYRADLSSLSGSELVFVAG